MKDDWKDWLLWLVGIIALGLLLRDCDSDRVPDYNCVEQVTPWGVECG